MPSPTVTIGVNPCILLYYFDTLYSSMTAYSQDATVMDDKILTIKEVAKYLKVNERTIYRLAASGDIPAFKVGNSWRFRKAEIGQWIEQQEQLKNR